VPGERPDLQTRAYDRRFLLTEKRNELVDLWEVQRYGRDAFGDPDFVSIYGLKPAEWYARGVRLLGRTAVECTRDRFAGLIASDLAAVARTVRTGDRSIVIDPFAGSETPCTGSRDTSSRAVASASSKTMSCLN
jgi:hypothetical protein